MFKVLNRQKARGGQRHGAGAGQDLVRLFYFYIFRKYFLQKYILNITIYSFVPLPPGRGAAGGLPPSSGAAGTYM